MYAAYGSLVDEASALVSPGFVIAKAVTGAMLPIGAMLLKIKLKLNKMHMIQFTGLFL
jgi:adenosylmethionine-8-amino-7-oxononanoate aminotransferase